MKTKKKEEMTMKTRWIVLIALVAVLLGIGTGLAVASQHRVRGWDRSGMMAAFETMHRSPVMGPIHAQMPPEVRQQCEAMHGQMVRMIEHLGGTMGSRAMHSGSGMSAGMMGPVMMGAGMAGHHTASVGR